MKMLVEKHFPTHTGTDTYSDENLFDFRISTISMCSHAHILMQAVRQDKANKYLILKS